LRSLLTGDLLPHGCALHAPHAPAFAHAGMALHSEADKRLIRSSRLK